MGCKISKEWNLDQGKDEYLLLTSDFGSLQMRITTSDTFINPSTMGHCDPGLYDIYRADTLCPDAHSSTAKMVFVDSVGGVIIDVDTSDGQKHIYENFGVKVTRDNKDVWIEAKDIKVGDTIKVILNDPKNMADDIPSDSNLKVTKVDSHHPTVKEVKGFTKVSRQFGAWRRVSKTVNFGVLFGCTAPTLAKQLENAGYTEAEAEEYLNLTNNMPLYNQLLAKNRNKMKPGKVLFLAAGTLMLEAYYKGFPGVRERAIREKTFAWKHGYSRMWQGCVKHLPELRYMLRNAKGELIGADKKMWSSMFSNLNNEAGNAPIQCLESNIAIKTIVCAVNYAREWKLKSYLWNMVHDSEDWCVYKPELNLVCSLINACSTVKREPYNGINMCMDFSLCDPAKGHQKNMYHGGDENPFPIDSIEVAVEKWNNLNKNKVGFTPIVWHGCSI